jgi:conjugative transfer pilus assembly protein TraH
MNKIMTSLVMALVLFYLSTAPVYAGLDDDMHSFLDNMDVMSNMQTPGSFEAGGRQIFSGGSMSMRFKTDIPPVVTYQPPSLRVSCSGMDFNAGLISILNLDMIQKILEQGGTSLTWGLLIGLSYSLPTVANVFEKIQKYTRWLQMLEGNMCEIGKNLGTSIGEMIGGGYEKNKTEGDVASGSVGTITEALKDLFDNPADFAKKTRGNIIYDVVHGIGGFDSQTVEAIMGMFGTIVWHPTSDMSGQCTPSEPETEEIHFYVHMPNLEVKTLDVINKLVNGGAVDIYECGATCAAAGIVGTTCTALNPGTATINGLKEEVYNALISAVNKLATGDYLDTEESSYLTVPILPNFTDIIMYLATMQRQGYSVSNDIDNLATYYSYWLIEYVLSYISDTVYKSIPIMLQNKKVIADVGKQITEFSQNFKRTNSEIHDVFRQQRESFVEAMSQSQLLEQFVFYKTSFIKGLSTTSFNTSLSGSVTK